MAITTFYNTASKAALSNSVYVNLHHNPMMHACGVNKVNFTSPLILTMLKTDHCMLLAVNHCVMVYLGSLESTQETRVALGCASSNPYACFEFLKLYCMHHNWMMHAN